MWKSPLFKLVSWFFTKTWLNLKHKRSFGFLCRDNNKGAAEQKHHCVRLKCCQLEVKVKNSTIIAVNIIPCSPPRAAHSHSSSVGSLLLFQLQKAWASFQLTWTTGKSRRSRIPEPGPEGWTVEGQRAWQKSRHGRKATIILPTTRYNKCVKKNTSEYWNWDYNLVGLNKAKVRQQKTGKMRFGLISVDLR